MLLKPQGIRTSDQSKFSPFNLWPEIYNTVWRAWHLITCSDGSWSNCQFSLSLVHFLYELLGELVSKDLGVEPSCWCYNLHIAKSQLMSSSPVYKAPLCLKHPLRTAILTHHSLAFNIKNQIGSKQTTKIGYWERLSRTSDLRPLTTFCEQSGTEQKKNTFQHRQGTWLTFTFKYVILVHIFFFFLWVQQLSGDKTLLAFFRCR